MTDITKHFVAYNGEWLEIDLSKQPAFVGDWNSNLDYPPGVIVLHDGSTWGTVKGAPAGQEPVQSEVSSAAVSLVPKGSNDIADAPAVSIISAGTETATIQSKPFTNSTYTTQTGEVATPQTNGKNRSAWWTYKPIYSGNPIFDTIGSTGDTVMNIYRLNATTFAGFGDLISIGGDDDAGGSSTSKYTLAATANITYYIQVGSYGANSTMDYMLRLTNAPATSLPVYWDELSSGGATGVFYSVSPPANPNDGTVWIERTI